jgi:hypothetical protein
MLKLESPGEEQRVFGFSVGALQGGGEKEMHVVAGGVRVEGGRVNRQ